jgi:xanthine dehydrogenase YagS FAD-binding subunit
MLPNFSYVRVKSLQEAINASAVGGTSIIAGGTDLLGCLRDGVFSVDRLVSIGRLKDLKGISRTADGGLRIGALTTITEIVESPLIKETIPGLAQAASEVASPALRNRGTVGGNLCQKPRCWYYRGEFHCLRKGGDTCYAMDGENQYHGIFGSNGQCCVVHPSDTAPMLVALGASIRVAGPKGNRLVQVEKFFVLPQEDVHKETVLGKGEIVTEVLIPKPPSGLRTSYRKVRVRQAWDFALAGVALALVFTGDRVDRGGVVLSGAAPIPWRSKAVEQVVAGRRLDAETSDRAAEAAVKNAQPLEHNEYKISLFREIVQEELTKLARG